MIINTEMLYGIARLPEKSADGVSSTLFACLADDDDGFIDIEPHSALKISTGVSIDIPAGYIALICPDSSLAAEQGLDIAGGLAVMTGADSGECFVTLHNDSDYVRTVVNGQAVARIFLVPVLDTDFR